MRPDLFARPGLFFLFLKYAKNYGMGEDRSRGCSRSHRRQSQRSLAAPSLLVNRQESRSINIPSTKSIEQ